MSREIQPGGGPSPVPTGGAGEVRKQEAVSGGHRYKILLTLRISGSDSHILVMNLTKEQFQQFEKMGTKRKEKMIGEFVAQQMGESKSDIAITGIFVQDFAQKKFKLLGNIKKDLEKVTSRLIEESERVIEGKNEALRKSSVEELGSLEENLGKMRGHLESLLSLPVIQKDPQLQKERKELQAMKEKISNLQSDLSKAKAEGPEVAASTQPMRRELKADDLNRIIEEMDRVIKEAKETPCDRVESGWRNPTLKNVGLPDFFVLRHTKDSQIGKMLEVAEKQLEDLLDPIKTSIDKKHSEQRAALETKRREIVELRKGEKVPITKLDKNKYPKQAERLEDVRRRMAEGRRSVSPPPVPSFSTTGALGLDESLEQLKGVLNEAYQAALPERGGRPRADSWASREVVTRQRFNPEMLAKLEAAEKDIEMSLASNPTESQKEKLEMMRAEIFSLKGIFQQPPVRGRAASVSQDTTAKVKSEEVDTTTFVQKVLKETEASVERLSETVANVGVLIKNKAEYPELESKIKTKMDQLKKEIDETQKKLEELTKHPLDAMFKERHGLQLESLNKLKLALRLGEKISHDSKFEDLLTPEEKQMHELIGEVNRYLQGQQRYKSKWVKRFDAAGGRETLLSLAEKGAVFGIFTPERDPPKSTKGEEMLFCMERSEIVDKSKTRRKEGPFGKAEEVEKNIVLRCCGLMGNKLKDSPVYLRAMEKKLKENVKTQRENITTTLSGVNKILAQHVAMSDGMKEKFRAVQDSLGQLKNLEQFIVKKGENIEQRLEVQKVIEGMSEEDLKKCVESVDGKRVVKDPAMINQILREESRKAYQKAVKDWMVESESYFGLSEFFDTWTNYAGELKLLKIKQKILEEQYQKCELTDEEKRQITMSRKLPSVSEEDKEYLLKLDETRTKFLKESQDTKVKFLKEQMDFINRRIDSLTEQRDSEPKKAKRENLQVQITQFEEGRDSTEQELLQIIDAQVFQHVDEEFKKEYQSSEKEGQIALVRKKQQEEKKVYLCDQWHRVGEDLSKYESLSKKEIKEKVRQEKALFGEVIELFPEEKRGSIGNLRKVFNDLMSPAFQDATHDSLREWQDIQSKLEKLEKQDIQGPFEKFL